MDAVQAALKKLSIARPDISQDVSKAVKAIQSGSTVSQARSSLRNSSSSSNGSIAQSVFANLPQNSSGIVQDTLRQQVLMAPLIVGKNTYGGVGGTNLKPIIPMYKATDVRQVISSTPNTLKDTMLRQEQTNTKTDISSIWNAFKDVYYQFNPYTIGADFLRGTSNIPFYGDKAEIKTEDNIKNYALIALAAIAAVFIFKEVV